MPVPILLIVSHPDDETLGCAHVLLRQAGSCFVLHTTNGAPSEARFWEQAGVRSRQEYAVARREELLAAMDVFGLPPEQMRMLSFGDRELPHHLPALVHQIRQHIEAFAPAVVYTHAFEGGHPDHDSTRYAVDRALQILSAERHAVPAVREFAGYHALNGEFCSGAFLEQTQPCAAEMLDAAETRRKRRALDCYKSQQRVIQRFALSPELWRDALVLDFTKRPQAGLLYYEIREMGYRFEEFASLACASDRVLGARLAAPPRDQG